MLSGLRAHRQPGQPIDLRPHQTEGSRRIRFPFQPVLSLQETQQRQA